MSNLQSSLHIASATPADVPVILQLIRELAEFERLLDQVTATEEQLREGLFGPKPSAEVIMARLQPSGEVAGFALFFHNFSTFLAKPGIYLEDLYVRQAYRGKGYGTRMLKKLAQLAVERDCGRFEWMVLDWNTPAIQFYESLGAALAPEWKLCRMTGEALQRFAATAR